MFVYRHPKKLEHLSNHLFNNQLWFAFVIMNMVIMCCCGGGETAATGNVTDVQQSEQEVKCAMQHTCLECIGQASPCIWLLATQTCNRSTAETTYTPQPLIVYEAQSCPTFDVAYNKSADEFGIMQHKVNVTVSTNDQQAAAFWALLRRKTVECHMNEVSVDGTVNEDERRIDCEVPEIKVTNPAMSTSPFTYVTVTVDGVVLAFNDRLDHYLDLHHFNGCLAQQVYKNECVSCAWDDEGGRRYYCRWCSSNDDCTGLSQNCDVRLLSNVTYSQDATDVDVRCPVARVESVVPAYGSWAGGTTVRVTVTNHKILSEHSLMVVTVANNKCLLPSTTKDGTQITCTISPTGGNLTRPADGPVRVTYVSQLDDRPERHQVTVRSDQWFRFVEPEITGMRPTCGPIAGGTSLTVRGNYLDAGSSVRVFIHENITCEVRAHSQNEVTCMTGASGVPLSGRVKLEFGGYLEKYVHHALFEYTGEPTVDGNQTFSGIASGGTRMLVRGRYFTCIENPLVYVIRHGIRHTGPCHVLNSTAMVCITPKLNRPVPRVITEQLQYGFQADFSKTILPLRPPPGSPMYQLHPDPVYTDFQTDGGRTVTINGMHLDQGYDMREDLSVQLQHTAVPCNVTHVGDRTIVCQTPPWTGGSGSTAAVAHGGIIVTLGTNMAYEVKRNPEHVKHAVHMSIFFSAVAIVLLVVTMIVALVYCLRIASNASHRRTEMQSLSENCTNYNVATFDAATGVTHETTDDKADPDTSTVDNNSSTAATADNEDNVDDEDDEDDGGRDDKQQ